MRMSFILEEKSLCKKSAEEDLLLQISGTANHHPHVRRMIIMKINLVFVSWMLSRWTLYSHHMHIVITVVIKRPQWWDIVCSAIKDNICSLVQRLCPPTLILPSSILLSFIEHGFLICMFSQMNLHWWENVLFVQSGPDISSVLLRPPICLIFSFFICINKIKQIIIREK